MPGSAQNTTESLCKHFAKLCVEVEGLQIDDSSSIFSTTSFSQFETELQTNVGNIKLLCKGLHEEYCVSKTHNQKEIKDLLDGILPASDRIVKCIRNFPIVQGAHLFKHIWKSVVRLIANLKSSMDVLNTTRPPDKSEFTKLVYLIIENCEELEKMPKNNLEACLPVIKNEELLIVDALEEFEQAVKNNAIGLAVWNDEEKDLLGPSLGLLKTARSSIKKILQALTTSSNCSNEENIKKLDSVTYIIMELSPAVDNFVCNLYPPVDKVAAKNTAMGLVNILQNLLRRVRRMRFITIYNDPGWVSFLVNAVEHNNYKLQSFLQSD